MVSRCSSSSCSRSGPNVPAKTSTTPDARSTDTTPAIAVMSSTTPPNIGTDAPLTPLRPAVTVTGTSCAAHARTTRCTSAVSRGETTATGSCGTCDCNAHRMASGHQSRACSASSRCAVLVGQMAARSPSNALASRGAGAFCQRAVIVPLEESPESLPNSIGGVGRVTIWRLRLRGRRCRENASLRRRCASRPNRARAPRAAPLRALPRRSHDGRTTGRARGATAGRRA